MGPCTSTNSTRKDRRISENTIDPNQKRVSTKVVNPHSIIKFMDNQRVLKQINDIKGDMIVIEGCNNSNIIIMDYSATVIIEKCNNTNFFIAPSKSRLVYIY
jgi:hypothetical protein